jgi:hypothetical protein
MLAQKNSILHRKPKDLIVGPTASSIETEHAKELARDAARAKRKADLVRGREDGNIFDKYLRKVPAQKYLAQRNICDFSIIGEFIFL